MPIAKVWSNFNWEKLDEVPDVYGVFELGDSAKNVIYIGEGKTQDELKSYKRSKDACKIQARKFRYEQMPSKERAEQRERALLREFERIHKRLPRCNKRVG